MTIAMKHMPIDPIPRLDNTLTHWGLVMPFGGI